MLKSIRLSGAASLYAPVRNDLLGCEFIISEYFITQFACFTFSCRTLLPTQSYLLKVNVSHVKSWIVLLICLLSVSNGIDVPVGLVEQSAPWDRGDAHERQRMKYPALAARCGTAGWRTIIQPAEVQCRVLVGLARWE